MSLNIFVVGGNGFVGMHLSSCARYVLVIWFQVLQSVVQPLDGVGKFKV